MNAKDLSGIETVKVVKQCWEADGNFGWDEKNVADREIK